MRYCVDNGVGLEADTYHEYYASCALHRDWRMALSFLPLRCRLQHTRFCVKCAACQGSGSATTVEPKVYVVYL